MTAAKAVKAFSQVGAAVMARAGDRKAKPLQFIASDDDDARATVIRLATDIGFDARDAGGLDCARELEGMVRLWTAQAFGHGMRAKTTWLLRPIDPGRGAERQSCPAARNIRL